jgi:glycosyltransferase involved in cell wall biosynthesis
LDTIPGGEVIVVDDASTDQTLPALRDMFFEEIASGRLRIICNNVNIGVSGSKNIGFEAARHAWVVFLDSDDWYFDGIGREFLDVLNDNSGRPIVFFRCVDESGKFVGQPFENARLLDLHTYLTHTTYGEALTAINKKMVGPTPPYVTNLRGYEGLGCCRLIARFGPAVLSSVVARVYDTSGEDRLSSGTRLGGRLTLLAQGHMLMLKEFSPSMRLSSISGYLLKALVYYVSGRVYQFVVKIRK